MGWPPTPPEYPGLSELFSAVLKEGTTTRSSRQIAEQLQAVGGSIAAFSAHDADFVRVDGLATGAATVLEILADVARNAAFPANEVELARTHALQGLMARQSTPDLPANRAFRRAVFADHPYAVAAPTERTLQAATPELLRQELSRRFRPDQALLVVSGDFEPQAIDEAVTKSFGSWRAPDAPPLAGAPPPRPTERQLLLVDRPGSVQSLILAGGPTVTVADPGWYPLLVANTAFAGSFTSRLITHLREEKGYSYSPWGSVDSYRSAGLLQLRADVRNEVTGPALEEILIELERMGREPPNDEELSRARRFQIGLYLLRNQTQASVAMTLARNWVNGLPPAALAELVPKVAAVTAEEVRETARTVYRPQAQTIVVVGEKQAIAGALARFGEFTEVQP